MEKQFVTHEIAQKLENLGFNEECFAYFDTDGLQISKDRYFNPKNLNSLFPEPKETNNPKISVPLWQQAIDFLEAELECCITTFYNSNHGKWGYSIYPLDERLDWTLEDEDESSSVYGAGTHDSKPNALKTAIEVCIENFKEIKSGDFYNQGWGR